MRIKCRSVWGCTPVRLAFGRVRRKTSTIYVLPKTRETSVGGSWWSGGFGTSPISQKCVDNRLLVDAIAASESVCLITDFSSYTERQVRTVKLVRKTGRVAMDGSCPKDTKSKRAPRSPFMSLSFNLIGEKKKQKRARRSSKNRLIVLKYERAGSSQGEP